MRRGQKWPKCQNTETEYKTVCSLNREVSWECLAGFYMPVSALLLVNVFFYWTAQRTMAKQMLYNRSMQHFQVEGKLAIGNS